MSNRLTVGMRLEPHMPHGPRSAYHPAASAIAPVEAVHCDRAGADIATPMEQL